MRERNNRPLLGEQTSRTPTVLGVGPEDLLSVLADALWPHLEPKLAEKGAPEDVRLKPAALNRRQAAEYLGMTPNGLRKRSHPLLQPRRIPGYARPIYFRRDLDAWLALGQSGQQRGVE